VTQDNPRPTKHTFARTQRLLDKFFKVDEYKGTYEKYDNTMSEEQTLLVFERGDSVAALLYDPAQQEVILVEQFRLPTARAGQGGGWILELPAGILKEDETVHASIVRELLEETGYQVSQFIPIATFFPSPGGTSERIFLFYTEVRRTHQKAEGGGVPRDNENIRIVRMPIAEFFTKLRGREFEDGKLIIAAHWLKDRQATMPIGDAAYLPPVEHRLKLAQRTNWLGRKSKPRKIIGHMQGGIEKVKGVDVWVNPLASDMLLDKFTDRSVSAAIRRGGAEMYPDGKQILRDTIGEELREKMNGRSFVAPATVLDTSPGGLKKHNGVRRIYHVATIRLAFDDQPVVDLETLDRCVANVLAGVERAGIYRSVLFPMIGTGQHALRVNQVAPRLLERAITYFTDNPGSRINRIYFLAYSAIDAEILRDAFEKFEPSFEPIDGHHVGEQAAV
jgi:ADP-ribose pyrophosphatase